MRLDIGVSPLFPQNGNIPVATHTVYLALGSNLGDRRAHLAAALQRHDVLHQRDILPGVMENPTGRLQTLPPHCGQAPVQHCDHNIYNNQVNRVGRKISHNVRFCAYPTQHSRFRGENSREPGIDDRRYRHTIVATAVTILVSADTALLWFCSHSIIVIETILPRTGGD